MKTLTKLLLPVSCFASLLTAPVFAHHTDFAGPGAPIGTVSSNDKGSVTRVKNIGKPYKFTFRGLQCLGHGFGGAAGSANAGIGWEQEDSGYQTETTSAAATTPLTYSSNVNGVPSGSIEFKNQYQASWCGSGQNENALPKKGKPVSTVLTPIQTRTNAAPTIFTNKDITLTWICTTNYADCDPWTVLTILGDIVWMPPVPQGALDIRSYTVEGASFSVGWNVDRQY